MLRIDLEAILRGDANADKVLQAQDVLTIYKQSFYADRTHVNVDGAVRLPGKFDLNPNDDIRVRDLVLLSGGLKQEAFPYAFLFRMKSIIPKIMKSFGLALKM